jgi:hypothetical protein
MADYDWATDLAYFEGTGGGDIYAADANYDLGTDYFSTAYYPGYEVSPSLSYDMYSDPLYDLGVSSDYFSDPNYEVFTSGGWTDPIAYSFSMDQPAPQEEQQQSYLAKLGRYLLGNNKTTGKQTQSNQQMRPMQQNQQGQVTQKQEQQAEWGDGLLSDVNKLFNSPLMQVANTVIKQKTQNDLIKNQKKQYEAAANKASQFNQITNSKATPMQVQQSKALPANLKRVGTRKSPTTFLAATTY